MIQPVQTPAPTPETGPIADAISAVRPHLVRAALFSAFLNLLYLTPTIYMLQVYDRVVPTRGELTLWVLTAILVLAVATMGALEFVRGRLLARASMRVDRLLAGWIIESLLKLSARTGARSAGLLREFDAARQTMTGAGAFALFDIAWSPIYLIVCFMLHWALGTMAIVGAVILMAMSWASERATRKSVEQASTAANAAYRALDVSLASSGVVQALGMRTALVQRHIRERREAAAMQSEAAMTGSTYLSVVKAVRILLQSLALGLGALLAIEHMISGGAIFAASLLIARTLAPIELVTGAWKGLIQARAFRHSLNELARARGEDRAPTRLPAPQGRVAVENLTVVAPGSNKPLLSGVSFALEPGEMLGIVGPSGAGKSTLVKALAGAIGIQGGAIRLDGASLGDWPEEQLAAAIGYVPQEPSLFRGTIKENIARFESEIDGSAIALDEEVVRAATLCGAHGFILRLPAAYDSPIGFQGSGLSVGQAQRLALARALYRNPPVLILDEPNASLDAEGEKTMMAALAGLRAQGVTILIVAHRTGIIANADKMLVISEGRVQLFGPRAQVMARLSGARPVAVEAAS